MRARRRRRVWNPDPGVLQIVQVLLLLQAGFALLSTIEVTTLALVTATVPLLVPSMALTGAAAVGGLVLVAALGRRSSIARRLVVCGEAVVMLVALFDLALALLLARAPLDLVPMLTQLALPAWVIVLLWRSRPRRRAMPLGAGA